MITKDYFKKEVVPMIAAEARKRGYIASAVVAQAICESNWGTSGLSSNYYNFWGMKCGSSWKGRSVNMLTHEEYKPGTVTSIRDNFRAYDSIPAGIAGYFEFIESLPRYSNLKSAKTPIQYFQLLKQDGWATSATYVNTLTSIWNNMIKNGIDRDALDRGTAQGVLDIDRVARDVIAGKYGNGQERRERLAAAGYSYIVVQARVNELLKNG